MSNSTNALAVGGNSSTDINIKVDATNVDYNRIYLYDNLSFGISAGKFNRDLKLDHIKHIKKGLLNGEEWKLGLFEVDIDSKLITDGNHRYEAIKDALKEGYHPNRPFRVVYVKLEEGQTVAERIAANNAHRKNWSAQDYIECLANQGDKYALELAEFCNERPLLCKVKVNKKTGVKTIIPTMRYGGWFIKGVNCSPLFKKGEYWHTQEELEEAKVIYSEVEKIFKAIKLEKTNTGFGEFVAAWRMVRNEEKAKIASLPNGFDSLIPEFEKGIYVNETTIVNQLLPNANNLRSVINSAVGVPVSAAA